MLILPRRVAKACDSLVGFSFLSCNLSAKEWSPNLASECLHTHKVEFSHHLGDLGITDVLASCWALAQFYVAGQVDETGVRHMVVRIVADLLHDLEYVCIFEDSQPESQAVAMARCHWHLIREIRGVIGGQIRSRLDGDYSPSKPLAKALRRKGPVASLFAEFP